MSRLETVSNGEIVFDMQYIRTKSEAMLVKCKEAVEALKFLGDNRTPT